MVSNWKPWPSAWFGYEVWKKVSDWGFGSGYKVARNFIGIPKWFFTVKSAQAYADKLNQEQTP